MAFTMKGSPMKRNFGIGASPAKKTYKEAYLTRGKKYQDMDEATYIKEAKRQNIEEYNTTEPTKVYKTLTKEQKATSHAKGFIAKKKAQAKRDATGVDKKRNEAYAKAKKEAAQKKKNIEVTKKINKRRTDENDKKVKARQKLKSDVTKLKMTEGTTRKRTKTGKLAVKAANLFRKNKKDPNRVKDNSKVKANKKAEKKAARVNKKLDKITAKREKISSKKDMTVKQARRANKRTAKLAAKANKIQAKAKKKILKK